MAQYDLTPRVIPFLDRHMTLPLLEFLEERQMYDSRSILKSKMAFAESTKMLDLFASEYKLYYGADKEPPQLEQRRQAVYNEMHAYQAQLGDLLGLLSDEVNDAGEVIKPAPALTLRENNQFTAEYLAEHYNITAHQIDLLFRYAKFNFEIGRYRDAADQLFYYRELVKVAPAADGHAVDQTQNTAAATNSYWALWGKCAGEILMANMDVAYNDLQQLFALLESNVHADQLEQLQQRTWLLHWSLFVFFNLPNGRALLIEFFMQEKMLNTIQVNAPHLLRYLTCNVILQRRRKNILKDLTKILVASRSELPVGSSAASLAYTDPLIDFMLSLYVDYNFEAAMKHLTAARTMLANDFFTESIATEIIENARIMLFEVYCSVHSRVDMKKLNESVDLSGEIKLDKEGELVLEAAPADKKVSADDDAVLVSMIRACHVQARIDSYHSELFLTGEHPSIYSQVMQRTNNATFRTQQLAQGIAKRIVGKRQQAEAE